MAVRPVNFRADKGNDPVTEAFFLLACKGFMIGNDYVSQACGSSRRRNLFYIAGAVRIIAMNMDVARVSMGDGDQSFSELCCYRKLIRHRVKLSTPSGLPLNS